MSKRILITGGAGFIGSHLCDELLNAGYAVRVLDNLCPQVHGPDAAVPEYLSKEAEFVRGDVRDLKTVQKVLSDIDAVFHLAAAVGVGQSMYRIEHYTSVNNLGTATLLEALLKQPVAKLVVASSMSIYGEGLYGDSRGRQIASARRTVEQLKCGQWDICDEDQIPLCPIATPETKMSDLSSIYALSKYDQEQLCLIFGRAYNIDTTALRFFNVFGTRQALSNPYTGVLAIFASRYLNDQPPLIYEDGHQRRDFVHVKDVARACRMAMEQAGTGDRVLNIGSGQSISIMEVARKMAAFMDKTHIHPQITGRCRIGDIRHCFGDISAARSVMGFEPQISFEEGLFELSRWLGGQMAANLVDHANHELELRGLTYARQPR